MSCLDNNHFAEYEQLNISKINKDQKTPRALNTKKSKILLALLNQDLILRILLYKMTGKPKTQHSKSK